LGFRFKLQIQVSPFGDMKFGFGVQDMGLRVYRHQFQHRRRGW